MFVIGANFNADANCQRMAFLRCSCLGNGGEGVEYSKYSSRVVNADVITWGERKTDHVEPGRSYSTINISPQISVSSSLHAVVG
jgi:hypothetical protein